VSDNLPDDPETLKAMLLAERHESERLRQIIKELQRHHFGRKAETLPEEQMLLGLEDVQQVAACTEASQDETAPEGRAERARKRRNNRGALPAHLPRIEVVVDLDAKTCPCCKGDPLAYLTDVLTRIVNGHPNRDIDQLLPWAYRAQALKAVA
jgi:transposase